MLIFVMRSLKAMTNINNLTKAAVVLLSAVTFDRSQLALGNGQDGDVHSDKPVPAKRDILKNSKRSLARPWDDGIRILSDNYLPRSHERPVQVAEKSLSSKEIELKREIEGVLAKKEPSPEDQAYLQNCLDINSNSPLFWVPLSKGPNNTIRSAPTVFLGLVNQRLRHLELYLKYQEGIPKPTPLGLLGPFERSYEAIKSLDAAHCLTGPFKEHLSKEETDSLFALTLHEPRFSEESLRLKAIPVAEAYSDLEKIRQFQERTDSSSEYLEICRYREPLACTVYATPKGPVIHVEVASVANNQEVVDAFRPLIEGSSIDGVSIKRELGQPSVYNSSEDARVHRHRWMNEILKVIYDHDPRKIKLRELPSVFSDANIGLTIAKERSNRNEVLLGALVYRLRNDLNRYLDRTSRALFAIEPDPERVKGYVDSFLVNLPPDERAWFRPILLKD